MLARKSSLITGPTVRTCASTIVKTNKNGNSRSDSDATIILDETLCPQTPKKKPIRGHNPKIGKKNQIKNICHPHLLTQKRRIQAQKEGQTQETILI